MNIQNSKQEFYTYTGAIHIHSKYSDGTGDIYQISKAAKQAGLKWIIITDHNDMSIEEGIFNDVYVIKGEEISPKQENHYLAFDIQKTILPKDNPAEFIKEVNEQGGFGFIAHPDEADNRKNKAHPIKWTNKNIIGDGVEIWNWFSDWADSYNETNIFTIAYSYLFRNQLIKGPQKTTLEFWDELNNKSKNIIPSIGGVDAHALKISKYIIPIKIFPYKYCFKTLNNIINLEKPLAKDFQTAKKEILMAIKKGNNIIINQTYSTNNNKIPTFRIINNTQIAYCGQTISNDENTYIDITLPKAGEISIIFDGKTIYKENCKSLKYKIKENGKYRFEVRYKNKPWIYSNPIQVK